MKIVYINKDNGRAYNKLPDGSYLSYAFDPKGLYDETMICWFDEDEMEAYSQGTLDPAGSAGLMLRDSLLDHGFDPKISSGGYNGA
ncbi:hypothetical protein LCGC14_2196890 [marine sediment metagenome]|uniref:Uncharacterized protein n=1 Tax=marine sediment metagenome TaxID=412755 RepID=A0A0F9E528_9ZZZZ